MPRKTAILTDSGFLWWKKGWADSNNQMQQSGGLLLAAGLDGGNTFIFIPIRE